MSDKKWRFERVNVSLPEVFSSIDVPKNATQFRKMMSFVGPGLMVAVGYMVLEIGQPTLLVARVLAILCCLLF